MAGHMRDNKGQFKTGYAGMVKVGSKVGKAKKLQGQLKDRRLTTKTAQDNVNVTTRVRDVGNDNRLLNPAVITKDPGGKYKKGDLMPPMARLGLSKNQKARVEGRKDALTKSRSKRVKEASIKNVNDDAKAAKVREIAANNKKDAQRRAEIQRVADDAAKAKQQARPAPKIDSKEVADTKRQLEKERGLLKTFERTQPGSDLVKSVKNRIRMFEEKLKHQQEQDAVKAREEAKAAPKKAEIARLEKERRAAGEEMGEIRRSYEEHGDNAYRLDPDYQRAERKSNNLSGQLDKLVPGGGYGAGMFNPKANQRRLR